MRRGGASYPVIFYVKDNGTPTLSDTAAITITVSLLNAPPVLTDPGNKTVNEGQLLQFDLSAVDPNNDSVIYSLSQVPAGAALAGKRFTWTPLYTQAGTYRVTFYAKDNVSPPLVDSQTITITVNNVNIKPVLSNPGNRTINENQLLSITLSATDVNGDALIYSMTSTPDIGSPLTANQFNWTPAYSQAGTYSITFFARDNGTPIMSDSQTISITVNNVNVAPVLAKPKDTAINEN